ncbi:MAG TPA: hypothetical protein VJT74_00825 [Pyrinomonadaceae bacterium]|nr:hypothetical protein [Pyrinomonadaceae bacterium]
METPYAPPELHHKLVRLLCVLLLLVAAAAHSAVAQSTDIGFPTPVRTDEISGTITPRDLGDPRLTRYFYSFTGTPGDLVVTAESRNLEGDVDVFTAGALRPLAKISLYAGSLSSGGSQTIYLRTRQPLILRVEARTPNDAEGTFRVKFAGAFEPLGSEVPDPEPVVPVVTSESKGRRVTATGARIEEPPPPVTETATTQPETRTPEPEATPTPRTETPAATTAEAERPATTTRRTPRTRRTRTPRRTTRNRPAPSTAKTTPPPAEQPPATTPEPPAGPRLIIETRDGMRVERYMTTVRRVTVERGQMVVVTTDGKVERQPMSNVLRMSIEP